jgi:formylglycine-generating enzyme required for sulfatase activity
MPANTTAGTQSWNSATSAYGSCAATTCATSYHLEGGACLSDTRSCTPLPANATASAQIWNSGTSSYGACNATVCAAAYHVEGGACLSNTRGCSSLPANTTAGTQTWTGSVYASCIASACASGYEVNVGVCSFGSFVGTSCTLNAECASGNCATGPTGTANDRCAPIGMNYIPAGTFTMGSASTEVGRYTDETQHSVTISRRFFMGQTEVTQGQWKALSGGTNPSYFQSTTGTAQTTTNANDSGPAEYLDWYAALAFANAKSAAEGHTSCYTLTGCTDAANGWKDGIHSGCTGATFAGPACTGFRLPTESEWEYAARGGTITATYLGNLSGATTDCTTAQPYLDSIDWWCINSGNRSHAVGGKTANSFGLFDMLGNVWEWTGDWYNITYPGTVTDPLGAASGANRVFRGGSWSNPSRYARAAGRYSGAPSIRYGNLGLRLARTVP